jgi:hypothetical protein
MKVLVHEIGRDNFSVLKAVDDRFPTASAKFKRIRGTLMITGNYAIGANT